MLMPYYCLSSQSTSGIRFSQKEEMSVCHSNKTSHQVLSTNQTKKYCIVTSNYYSMKKSKSGIIGKF